MSNIKYKKIFCEEITEWLGKGYSYITWGPSHTPRISVATMYEWEKSHPEWSEAKSIGYALGLKFFESLLISETVGVLPEQLKKMNSKGINLTSVMFALKTRFHKEYGEINKIDHTSNGKTLNVNFIDNDGNKPT